MSEHWNVQIHVQRVIEKEEMGRPSFGFGSNSTTETERRVVNVLDLKVTAASEPEAYLKVSRLMLANVSPGGSE